MSLTSVKVTLKEKKLVLSTYESRPPTTDGQRAEKVQLESEVKDLEAQLCELVLSEESGETAPQAAQGDGSWLESQILVTHLRTLNKFTGASAEATTTFIQQVKTLTESCPGMKFQTIYGAIRPCLSTSVLKTLNNSDVKSFNDFKKVLNTNYSHSLNIFQRWENWNTTSKRFGKSYTQWFCELSNMLEPIITSYQQELIKNKEAVGVKNYTPTFEDAFQLSLVYKMLNMIRSDSNELYSAIIIELSSLKTCEALASRAEALNCQTGMLPSHTLATAPTPKVPIKGTLAHLVKTSLKIPTRTSREDHHVVEGAVAAAEEDAVAEEDAAARATTGATVMIPSTNKMSAKPKTVAPKAATEPRAWATIIIKLSNPARLPVSTQRAICPRIMTKTSNGRTTANTLQKTRTVRRRRFRRTFLPSSTCFIQVVSTRQR